MRHIWYALAVFLPLILQPQLGAVTIGQVQTFDEPDHHWVIGVGPGGATPSDVPTELGGPGGPLDPYLSIVSTGTGGPGSRPSAQNFDEWSGNYLAAGITHIFMAVRNFGSTDLSLRLLFVDFEAMAPVNAAFTTDAVFVPGNSDWQTVRFAVSQSELTGFLGSANGALSNTDEFRIFHNPDPSFEPGNLPALAANLGVDNLEAAAIPEPAAWTLLVSGMALVCVARRRR
jgi:hypothetical protein